jgi:hypothetical protein
LRTVHQRKREKPAQNNAQLARRYALVPAIKPEDMIPNSLVVSKLTNHRAQYEPPAANKEAGFG